MSFALILKKITQSFILVFQKILHPGDGILPVNYFEKLFIAHSFWFRAIFRNKSDINGKPGV